MKNTVLKRLSLFLLLSGIAIWSILRPCWAEEAVPEADPLLTFVDNDPTKEEIVERITDVLKQNAARAKKTHETFGLFLEGNPWVSVIYRRNLMEQNYHWKQFQLCQWQMEHTADESIRQAAEQSIADIREKTLENFPILMENLNKMQELGHIFPADYGDIVSRLFQIECEICNFQGEEIERFLEKNAKETEIILKNQKKQIADRGESHFRTISLLALEAYLQQNQVELTYQQYENADDEESRNAATERLIAVGELHLDAAQKLVDLCSKWNDSETWCPVDYYIGSMRIKNKASFDLLCKYRPLLPNTCADPDEIASGLQSCLVKSRELLDLCERVLQEDIAADTRPRIMSTGMFNAKMFWRQAQLEFDQWQYNHEGDSSDATSSQLLESYKQRWITAKELAAASREAYDVGVTTVDYYLKSENALDQASLEMLHFLLNR